MLLSLPGEFQAESGEVSGEAVVSNRRHQFATIFTSRPGTTMTLRTGLSFNEGLNLFALHRGFFDVLFWGVVRDENLVANLAVHLARQFRSRLR